jgi:hypothetical protein
VKWNYIHITLAFNAALVIFSALLVKHISTRNAARPIPYPLTELSKSFLRQAVDTLMHLDNENRMVEKCAKYTSKLYNILEHLESSPSSHNAVSTNGNLTPLTTMQNFTNTILNPTGASNGTAVAAGVVSPQDLGYMVPNEPANFGIDMNEFLVSGDLDLLGHMGWGGFFESQ